MPCVVVGSNHTSLNQTGQSQICFLRPGLGLSFVLFKEQMKTVCLNALRDPSRIEVPTSDGASPAISSDISPKSVPTYKGTQSHISQVQGSSTGPRPLQTEIDNVEYLCNLFIASV